MDEIDVWNDEFNRGYNAALEEAAKVVEVIRDEWYAPQHEMTQKDYEIMSEAADRIRELKKG